MSQSLARFSFIVFGLASCAFVFGPIAIELKEFHVLHVWRSCRFPVHIEVRVACHTEGSVVTSRKTWVIVSVGQLTIPLMIILFCSLPLFR